MAEQVFHGGHALLMLLLGAGLAQVSGDDHRELCADVSKGLQALTFDTKSTLLLVANNQVYELPTPSQDGFNLGKQVTKKGDWQQYFNGTGYKIPDGAKFVQFTVNFTSKKQGHLVYEHDGMMTLVKSDSNKSVHLLGRYAIIANDDGPGYFIRPVSYPWDSKSLLAFVSYNATKVNDLVYYQPETKMLSDTVHHYYTAIVWYDNGTLTGNKFVNFTSKADNTRALNESVTHPLISSLDISGFIHHNIVYLVDNTKQMMFKFKFSTHPDGTKIPLETKSLQDYFQCTEIVIGATEDDSGTNIVLIILVVVGSVMVIVLAASAGSCYMRSRRKTKMSDESAVDGAKVGNKSKLRKKNSSRTPSKSKNSKPKSKSTSTSAGQSTVPSAISTASEIHDSALEEWNNRAGSAISKPAPTSVMGGTASDWSPPPSSATGRFKVTSKAASSQRTSLVPTSKAVSKAPTSQAPCSTALISRVGGQQPSTASQVPVAGSSTSNGAKSQAQSGPSGGAKSQADSGSSSSGKL